MVEKIISISQLDTVFNITDNEENATGTITVNDLPTVDAISLSSWSLAQ